MEFCYGVTKPEVDLYISRGLRYVVEIYFAPSAIIIPEPGDSLLSFLVRI